MISSKQLLKTTEILVFCPISLVTVTTLEYVYFLEIQESFVKNGKVFNAAITNVHILRGF